MPWFPIQLLLRIKDNSKVIPIVSTQLKNEVIKRQLKLTTVIMSEEHLSTISPPATED
jgi:hypothetical protein